VVTLKASKVFGQLAAAELKTLEKIAAERKFEKGEEIFKEGDAGDGCIACRLVWSRFPDWWVENARHVFSKIEPGDIFGEMAVIEDKPRSATAVSRQASTVYFFERGQMLELVSRSPAFSLILLREISSRLREFNRQYLREVLQSERLAIIGRLRAPSFMISRIR